MPKNPNLLEESLKMQGTSLILTMSLASILTVALLSAVPNQAFAQQVDFEYRCYNTSDILLPDQPSDILTLIDQFGTRDYNVLKAVEFCNPAIKSPEGNPAADPLDVLPHLRCWALGDKPALNIVVTLNDQFSDIPVEHTVLKAVEFCHTTTKGMGSLSGPAGPVFYDETANNHSPIHVANWICYDLSDKNTPAEPFRKLKDQFTITGANIGIGSTKKVIVLLEAISFIGFNGSSCVDSGICDSTVAVSTSPIPIITKPTAIAAITAITTPKTFNSYPTTFQIDLRN